MKTVPRGTSFFREQDGLAGRRSAGHAAKIDGIRRLDMLKETTNYAAITTAVMLKAAEFWAASRNLGRQSASDASLDGDVILAAQAAVLAQDGTDIVIATTNIRHLALFAHARSWREIK